MAYSEAVQHSFAAIDADSKIYMKLQSIVPLLDNMTNVSEIVFDEYGRQYGAGRLNKIEFLRRNQYSLQVKNVRMLQDGISIINYMIAIKEVRMDADLKITIITDIVATPIRKGKIYDKLNETMAVLESNLYISGNYCIILKSKDN